MYFFKIFIDISVKSQFKFISIKYIISYQIMIKKIYQVSEQVILCDFGKDINRNINSKVIKFFNYINSLNNNDKELFSGVSIN